LQLGANARRKAGAVADEVETVVVVEAEEDGRDPTLRLLAPAEADDRAVGGLVLLDLDDAVARARQIREPEALRDHAVEAGHLEALEPAPCDLGVPRSGRDLERQPL